MTARTNSNGSNIISSIPLSLNPATSGVARVAKLHNPTPTNINIRELTTLTANPIGKIAAPYP